MLLADLQVMGVSRSHPSGVSEPSMHDVNYFYGRIVQIAVHPFQSYSDMALCRIDWFPFANRRFSRASQKREL